MINFDANSLNAALDLIETEKGISKESVLQALKESLMRGLRKQLGWDDAIVNAEIDLDKGIIELYQVRKVVENVEDDVFEIEKDEAEELDPTRTYEIGDEFRTYFDGNDIRKSTAMTIKAVIKQKFSEAEKASLMDAFKDKIGTMVTGKIERIDEAGANVNIGKASVFLPRKQIIPGEKLLAGDNIKLFVTDVSMTNKGARINVSRSNEGFLKALFFEEIHEIYDGTIEIKAIARQAGERSKVAVYTNDPNVDPAGACIGPNGARIQKIVSQLGNGSNKEKIDIIAYSDNLSLFVMDALKPAIVLGINMASDNSSAIAIVKDDGLSVAIGRGGVNVKLASKLTGVHVDVKTETQAANENIEYKTFEEVQAEDIKAHKEELLSKENEKEDILPTLPEGYIAPQERVYEEEKNDFDESLLEQSEKEDIDLAETVSKETDTGESFEQSAKEEVVEEKIETPIKEEEKQEVSTTTTLEDLEKSLESDNSKNQNRGKKNYKKNNKKDDAETKEDSSSSVYKQDKSKYMSIYTQEELDELDEEEDEYSSYDDDDEDIDYDQYDEYYDDDNK